MRPVDLIGIHMEAGTGTPVLLLREHDAPHRLLPIFIGGPEAASIALAANHQTLPRPMTHDLMAALVRSLDAHLDAVEVTELREGTFIANLTITGPTGERRLDTRPSDAIALAMRLEAPLYVSEAVLDAAGAVPRDELDPDSVDAEVARFRTLLENLDASDFAGDEPDPDDPDRT